MQIDVDARYDFGLVFQRIMPKNADHSIPTVSRIVGGVGPFDYSSVSATKSAIPIYYKTDNGSVVSKTISLSSASDIAAVTLTELLAACTAATLTGITTSKETGTDRFKIALTSPSGKSVLQVWGPAVELAGVGQGYGCRYVKVDTAQTLQDEPDMKADEKKSFTDGNGQDISVIIPGYRMGAKITIIDTAHDKRLRAIMTGGVWDETARTFEEPEETAVKPSFTIEYFWAVYKKGQNQIGDRVGYIRRLVRNCKGSSAKADTHGLEMGKWTYEANATHYVDESGVIFSDAIETELDVDDFDALDVANV